MICIDNSEWMRNGDYAPSRFQAQSDAVNLICGAKTQVFLNLLSSLSFWSFPNSLFGCLENWVTGKTHTHKKTKLGTSITPHIGLGFHSFLSSISCALVIILLYMKKSFFFLIIILLFFLWLKVLNEINGLWVQSNPENTVGVLTMAGKGVRVLVTPTSDLGKILACMHG